MINRRKFFRNISFGAAGVALMNILPVKIFGGKTEAGEKIKIKIHPSAVKRNK